MPRKIVLILARDEESACRCLWGRAREKRANFICPSLRSSPVTFGRNLGIQAQRKIAALSVGIPELHGGVATRLVSCRWPSLSERVPLSDWCGGDLKHKHGQETHPDSNGAAENRNRDLSGRAFVGGDGGGNGAHDESHKGAPGLKGDG